MRLISTLFLLLFVFSSALLGQINPSDGCPATLLTVGASCVSNNYTVDGSYSNGGLVNASCVSNNDRDDGWYRFVATSTTTIVDATGDTRYCLSAWTACGGGTELACDNVNAAPASISFATTIGVTYFVQIHRRSGNNTATLTGTICIREPGGGGGGGPAIVPTACATQTFNILANRSFYDDGGMGGLPCTDGDPANFCNCNCETTTTICAPAGQSILVDFTVFAMFNTSSAFDWMKIYDGAGTGGTVLFDNDIGGPDNSPNGGTGSGYGDCGDDIPPSGFCSTTECLTFEFHASGVVNRAGWEANVTLVGPTCTILLPISTKNFEVKKEFNMAQIYWETSTETNNDYFTIERSANGIDWEDFAVIDGAGTSTQPIHYNYTDYQPLTGTSYYRLKQTSFDGQSSYSMMKAISFDEEFSSAVVLYPNPVSQQLTIRGDATEIGEFTIYNALGQDVSAVAKVLSQNGRIRILDLSNLSPGIYTFKTKTAVNKIHKE